MIALLISWVAAVVFVPHLGFHLLPDFSKKRKRKEGRFARAIGRCGWQPGAGWRRERRLNPRITTNMRSITRRSITAFAPW